MQMGLMFFCGLILDGGVVATVFCLLSVGFWIGVLILMRRPLSAMTNFDRLYLRHGLWAILTLSFVVATIMSEMTGGRISRSS